MKYYSANTEKYETIETTKLVHNQAGWTGEVDYGVCYRLPDGRYLTCTRSKDRGDLATDLRVHSRLPQMRGDLYIGGRPYEAAQ